jgi:hypothetical protein
MNIGKLKALKDNPSQLDAYKFKDDLTILGSPANNAASNGGCARCEFSVSVQPAIGFKNCQSADLSHENYLDR